MQLAVVGELASPFDGHRQDIPRLEHPQVELPVSRGQGVLLSPAVYLDERGIRDKHGLGR